MFDSSDSLGEQATAPGSMMLDKDLAAQLGRRIRVLRTALSLTQQELSERADISISFLSMAERGERLPHVNTLARVADKLGISISRLFQGVMEPVNNRQVLDPLVIYLEKVGATSADVEHLL